MRFPWQKPPKTAPEFYSSGLKETEEEVELSKQRLEESTKLTTRVFQVSKDLIQEKHRNHFVESLNSLYARGEPR